MNPSARRTVASATAWTAGALASVAVSLVALSWIDAGSAAGPSQQLAPDGLTRVDPGSVAPAGPSAGVTDAATEAASDGPAPPGGAAATPPAPAPPPSGSPAAAGSPAGGVQRLLSSPGGTVVARCSGAGAYLVSWSPAQGYQVARVERGPAPTAEVTFRDATGRIEMEVHCADGRPVLGTGWDDHYDR